MPDSSLRRAAVISSGQALLVLNHLSEIVADLMNLINTMALPTITQIYLMDGNADYLLYAQRQSESDTIAFFNEQFINRDRFQDVSKPGLWQDDNDPTRYYCALIDQDRTIGQVAIETDVNLMDKRLSEEIVLLSAFAAAAMNRQWNGNEQLLQQVQQVRFAAMSELASAVAHQLNNPLTALLANAELLLMQTDENDSAFTSLQSIERAGRRAAGVVNRLFGVSYADKSDGILQPINVLDTIQGGLYLIRNYIIRDRIELIENYADDVPSIWVYPDLLDDMWLNLLMNARDAVSGKRDAQIGIDVHYLESDAMVQVGIWNNGPKIPVLEREKIFTPFYTTKDPTEHIGLGLHICKQITEHINGHITVEDHESGGACFTVHIPVKKG